ncbi:MobF family relaxase [Mycetocola reblochoni]|uniref:TraA-like protein n=2 Tax=Mycetocola reblochoni TaxID=331618 RepID=A0A1R4JG75_9MICO|nr:MobF family relaxase [Mycetocola reblochoni]RLP67712.1 TrwC relaxase [Mycetocola reblochoni]SJN31018.1 TraA-like protein [Mycetocola reblochoni REB411]
MHGGVILFRGTGADALRYVEADRSRADDYYLSDGAGVEYAVLDASGTAVTVRPLSNEEYAGWVDWMHPDTGERMGTPRLAGQDRLGSPRFAEMTINGAKSLSIAAVLHPEVSEALDRAQQDALAEIRRWLALHSVTRVGPRGKQEVVPIEHMQVVGITHRTSRAGDPHRHIHMQIGTRVWAAGKWRALDTAAVFRQQGAIRALGTAVIAAHPELAEVLDRHGLTLDPVTGEVVELEPFNALMSKRGEQVRRNLERLEAEWNAAHPGETMGPVVFSRLTAQAWAHERPAKKPATLREEEAWLTELREAGYDPTTLRRPARPAPVSLDELSVQQIASRALNRCAAGASVWTQHTVQEHATQIITEAGVRATGEELRDLITLATRLAREDCFSVLAPDSATPEHVAHLTSLRVVQAETELRDLIAARVPKREPQHPNVREEAGARGIDAGQERAAAAVAADPLVIVEGAAGAGKTTMLGVAIEVAAQHGRAARVLAPTLRAAQVAHQELGVPTASVAALVHAHGWRWNRDGVWSRLTPGDTDPETGRTYRGPSQDARLARGERVIVDEAGMLDQDTAIALLTVCAEAGATVALVGDRAQLAAVGRGGVLDMAAQLRGRTFDMAEVHRFTDPAYADLTLRMRDGKNPGEVFDQLAALGLVRLHASSDEAREQIARYRHDGEAVTVSTNDEARTVNSSIRDERVACGEVHDTTTVDGSDGLPIGAGDLIQTRKNNTSIGVANRQQWIVQHVADDGSLSVREAGNGRKRQRTVRLPADYVTEHAHLSYAATSYGVQGTTVTGSHTLLTDQASAASVYVGMTRGRETNLLHAVAENQAEARAQFVAALERDRADRGLEDAAQRAAEAVAGLVADGPARRVRTAIARLTERAEQAEQRATRFTEFAERFDRLSTQHQQERAEVEATAQAATQAAEQLRESIHGPLRAAALTDAQGVLRLADAQERAGQRVRAAGLFARRSARKEHAAAQHQLTAARAHLTREWGNPSTLYTGNIEQWADAAATRRTDIDPRITQADQNATAARERLPAVDAEQRRVRQRLAALVYGAERARTDPVRAELNMPARDATTWAAKARRDRAEAAKLTAMTPTEAGQYLDARAAAVKAAKEAREARARQLRDTTRAHDPATPHRPGPGLSL